MNSKPPREKFVVVGLGSIGKTHLSTLKAFGFEALVVDTDIEVKKFLSSSDEYASIEYYSDLNLLPHSLDANFATIANWGPDHVNSIKSLLQLGIHNFIVEKPLASTLDSLDNLRFMVKDGDVNLVTNMPLSYGELLKKINGYKDFGLLGDLTSVVVSGGAKCLATNGIHYVGLTSKLFNSKPQLVAATVSNSQINPRNNSFLYLEGSSTWVYPRNRYLTVSFANNSHVQLSMTFYFNFGKIIVEQDIGTVLAINDEERNKANKPSKTFYAREVIETFDPYKSEDGLDGMGLIYKRIRDEDRTVWQDFEHGFESTEAIIAMLISSKEKSQIDFPLTGDIRRKYSSYEWLIS